MTPVLAAALAGLSLIDSTSFGTLLIPIWLMLTPGRIRPGRLAIYLGTVAIFYFVVGVALALGADVALEAIRRPLSEIPERALVLAQLVLGIALVVLSYVLEQRIRRNEGKGEGRLQRWRTRALTETGDGGGGPLVKLALIGTSIELLSMVPYLVAIGLLTAADLSVGVFGLSLAAYCLLMVLPATILGLGRVVFHHRVDRMLVAINGWFTRNSAKAVGWTLGGIGIGLGVNAIIRFLVEL